MHRTTGYLVGFVITPIAILMASEAIVRIAAPDDLTRHIGNEEMIDRRTASTIHVNRPGFSGQLWEKEVTIDENGLRVSGDSSGSFRVLLTGDSVVFGAGVDDSDAPGALLQSLVPDSIRVINGAVIGYATDHVLAYLREFGDKLNPDFVILGYCLNDAAPFDVDVVPDAQTLREKYGFAEWLNVRLRRNSLLFLWLKDKLKAYRFRHGYPVHRALFNGESWQRNQTALLGISEWCKRRGVPLLIAVFPHRDQLLQDDEFDFAPQDSLAAFGRRTGIDVVDLRQALSPEDFLWNDPLHLDRRGIRKSVSAIWEFLKSRLKAESRTRNG
ncbi:MAG: hypothetical protein KJO98_16550 [Rhodothermia bacterium]|nr:hypothetical protein [Rhodothermia bacterium]